MWHNIPAAGTQTERRVAPWLHVWSAFFLTRQPQTLLQRLVMTATKREDEMRGIAVVSQAAEQKETELYEYPSNLRTCVPT